MIYTEFTLDISYDDADRMILNLTIFLVYIIPSSVMNVKIYNEMVINIKGPHTLSLTLFFLIISFLNILSFFLIIYGTLWCSRDHN